MIEEAMRLAEETMVADEWRLAELARARKHLARGDDAEAVLDALARALTQKMLHGAFAELHAADAGHRAEVAEAVSRLFLRQVSRTPGDGEPTPPRTSHS